MMKRITTVLGLLVAVILLAGCTSANKTENKDVQSSGDVEDSLSENETSENKTCNSDNQPRCVSCGGDVEREPECIEGQWSCPDDSVPPSECSSEACATDDPPSCVKSCDKEDPITPECCRGSDSGTCEPGYFKQCPEERFRAEEC